MNPEDVHAKLEKARKFEKNHFDSNATMVNFSEEKANPWGLLTKSVLGKNSVNHALFKYYISKRLEMKRRERKKNVKGLAIGMTK